MAISRVRVLVMDDSPSYLKLLCDALTLDPAIELAGTVSCVAELSTRIVTLRPDVMVLSSSGSLAPVLVYLSNRPQPAIPVVVIGVMNAIEKDVLRAGAEAFYVRAERERDPLRFLSLMGNLKAIVKKIGLARPGMNTTSPTMTTAAMLAANASAASANMRADFANFSTGFTGILALGASAGGTEATSAVLRRLPANMPGMIIVQHMPPVFTKVYADRLNNECAITVQEAKDGMVVESGHAYVAPGGMQMSLVRRDGKFAVRCQPGEKVSGHCPSVDVMFDSVARVAGRNAVGIILTGMGNDGANGLLAMRKAGAYTIGQDEATSMVYGMPGVAFRIGAVVQQEPLDMIARALLNYLRTK